MLDLSHRQDLAWLARDLWLHYGHGFEVKRVTEDVDFALAVDWQGFSEARDALLASGLFESFRNVPHKLRH